MRREADDPGAVAAASFNMTPMIDVTFQLIVVFLCSMKFRTLDQKLEAFLPKTIGVDTRRSPAAQEARIDLRLRRGPGEGTTTAILLGSRLAPVGDGPAWEAIGARFRELHAKDPAFEGEVRADPDVPHHEVVRALDAFRAAGVLTVHFPGTAPPRRDPFAPAR